MGRFSTIRIPVTSKVPNTARSVVIRAAALATSVPASEPLPLVAESGH